MKLHVNLKWDSKCIQIDMHMRDVPWGLWDILSANIAGLSQMKM